MIRADTKISKLMAIYLSRTGKRLLYFLQFSQKQENIRILRTSPGKQFFPFRVDRRLQVRIFLF